jgi:hypothetical protein
MGQTVALTAVLFVLFAFYLSGAFLTPSDPICYSGMMGADLLLAASCYFIGTKDGWVKMCDVVAVEAAGNAAMREFAVAYSR